MHIPNITGIILYQLFWIVIGIVITPLKFIWNLLVTWRKITIYVMSLLLVFVILMTFGIAYIWSTTLWISMIAVLENIWAIITAVYSFYKTLMAGPTGWVSSVLPAWKFEKPHSEWCFLLGNLDENLTSTKDYEDWSTRCKYYNITLNPFEHFVSLKSFSGN